MGRLLTTIIFLIITSISVKGQCAYTIDTIKVVNNINVQLLVSGLEKTKLLTRNDKKFIPAFIKQFLNCMIKADHPKDSFAIANPKEWYNRFDFSHSDAYPDRQIQYLGINDNYMLMNYNYGGEEGGTFHTMIIKFKSDRIEDFWVGFSNKGTSKPAVISDLKKNGAKMKSTLLMF